MKRPRFSTGKRELAVVLVACLFVAAGCEVRRALSDGSVAPTPDAGTGASRDVVSSVPPRSNNWTDAAVRPPRDAGPAEMLRPLTRELDLLFMIDNSRSMQPLQTKLAARLPDFMEVLKNLPGGLPDVHVAVISSSIGAGAFRNVPGCVPGSPGSQDGRFQHARHCLGLNSGETFIRSVRGVNNFTGDITDVFTCIALIGDSGCGFEQQFEATRQALTRAANPADADNGGFLRPNAYLSVVMLTNEDDCSVPRNSALFDPNVVSVNDTPPLGGLQSYRCNEFGHLCDGHPLPHTIGAPMTFANCVSSEGNGKLTTVDQFVGFLKGLKPGQPEKLLVAAIAGPVTPYVVEPHLFQLVTGGMETQPRVMHSCTQDSGEFADPAVRIKQWVDAFGASGVFQPICASDFKPALVTIADAIGKKLVQ